MTSLLREIKKNQLNGYDVCFEATHHGPLLETPTIFLEIGSTEKQWEDEVPARILIKSLLEFQNQRRYKCSRFWWWTLYAKVY